MQLGEYLKKKNLTQAEFARLVGESIQNINRYVRGTRKPSENGAMLRIYEATGGAVTANDFYDLQPLRKQTKRNGVADA